MDNKTIWIVVGIILLLFVVPWGFGGMMGYGAYGGLMRGYGGYYGSMMSGNNFCGGFGGLWCYPPMSYVGGLVNLLVMVVIVLFIVWIVQRIGDKNGK